MTGDNGYSAGHPYYYKLGGKPLSLKTIRTSARLKALLEFKNQPRELVLSCELDKAVALKDPFKRKAAFNRAREHHHNALWTLDIPRYKECRRMLSIWRSTSEDLTDQFSSPETAISLKHNHLISHFRNLYIIKLYLDQETQPDLFGAL